MVQLVKYGSRFNTNVMRIDGLSTETKPTIVFEGINIANGSEFTEMDTDKKYAYDAENQQWIER